MACRVLCEVEKPAQGRLAQVRGVVKRSVDGSFGMARGVKFRRGKGRECFPMKEG